MKIAIITGSSGLAGSEAVHFLSSKFDKIIGIDNDARKYFFGGEASTIWNKNKLLEQISNYVHFEIDIRSNEKIENIFREFGSDIKLIIHCAAQPSHDWAAKEPFTDFSINANGTLNLLENTRLHCPTSIFIYLSTNKVYGDNPNKFPFNELETRWEIDHNHSFYDKGIPEVLSIDNCTHSLFGVSKTSGDLLAQEYGRYFNINTGIFRCGCITGSKHSGTESHGFLSYLMKCLITKAPYTIYGYKGKQVRDNIHSSDLINAFWHFYLNPKKGKVYNLGGSRFSNCSVIEAINLCEKNTNLRLNYTYSDKNRIGDHMWWISDVSKFQHDFPNWKYNYSLHKIIEELYRNLTERLR